MSVLLLLLAGAMLPSSGAAPSGIQQVPYRGDGSGSGYAFRVSPPEITWSRNADGSMSLAVEGCDTAEVRPGAPAVPTCTLRVAIPAGAVPRLRVTVASFRTVPDRIPASVPFREADVRLTDRLDPEPFSGRARQVTEHFTRRPDPSIYQGSSTWPGRVAWLGKVGVLRNQRFVEVHLAPVRFDPAVRGLQVASEMEIQVDFVGTADGTGSVRSSFRPDPVFESIYRTAFVNYGQGTGFRLNVPAGNSPLSSTAGASTASATDNLVGTRYRIRVRDYQVVRLDYTLMAGTSLITEPLSTWSVVSQGVQVPIHVNDQNMNDFLDPGDWVHFYGQPMDEEPKTRINQDYPAPAVDLYEASDFTDENIYFLGVETGAVARMPTRNVVPTQTRVPPVDFTDTAHLEVDDAWRPLGGADPWYWFPTLDSAVQQERSRTDSVPLPGLAGGDRPATVRVNVRGVSEDIAVNPDHTSEITLMNSSNKVLATDTAGFDGRTLHLHDFTWTFPGSGDMLTDPAKVKTDAVPLSGGDHTMILDWIEIDYQRLFQASGDVLAFSWPDEDTEFEISGFDTPPAGVYEVTDRVPGSKIYDVVRLTGATITGLSGNFTIRFRMDNDPDLPDGTQRRFIITGTNGFVIPSGSDFTSDEISDLKNNANQADLVVIAHPDVVGTGSRLQDLLDFRLSEQGLTSKIAMIQDVEDEFNNGLPGPDAIKNFLAWVLSTAPGEGWADPKPSYVLLVGDGSYDYKGGTASKNLVPTQIMLKDDPNLGYFTSDTLLAAVVGGDHLADLMIGRITATDTVGANTVLDKLLAYGQTPPTGNWRRHSLFISDQGKNNSANEALAFEDINNSAIARIKAPPHTIRNLRYWSDYGNGTQPDAIRADIKASVNGTDGFSDGAAVIQYTGHGNFVVWSDDAFFDERFTNNLDTDDLVNGDRLPFMINHNCLTGGFHTLQDNSMGEDWMKRVGGGAMSVYAPSGLGSRFIGEVVTDSLFDDMFGGPKLRQLGPIALNAQVDLCGQGSFEACEYYTLLGDPTARLILRDVRPATNEAAVSGHQQVELSWTASVTPGVTYDVYRTENLNTGYGKINSSPVTGTTYLDTGLINTHTYYYYIVAVDTEGFESAWSNFNSDCDVNGPDCLVGNPLNPNPPSAPTGVTATDAETGGRLNVSWNPNPESDIKSYEVRYGTSPGVYTDTQGAGPNTSAVLTGLTDGVRYYIAVVAENTSGKISAPSAEVSEVPHFILGLRPPAFIDTLVMEKQGIDLRISWAAVTTDIYGKDETVADYEVYRDLDKAFIPGPGNLVATVTGPEFIDTNALSASAPDYYYVVRAVDVDGNAGGAGRQLPDGIQDLSIGKSTVTPGNLDLSWAEVTTDFDGGPTIIDHYEIYAADSPFSRQDIADGLVPLLKSVTTPSTELTPAEQHGYLSVIVVDRRGQDSPF